MFSTSVDHSPFFDENSDTFYEAPGFPYSRFGVHTDEETDEKLLTAIHGKSAELVIVTNKRVAVYQIPGKKSIFKKVTGELIGQIPVVSDVMDGLEAVGDIKGSAKNFKGWATGKNKKERLRRLEEGLPSKKQFKNVEWDLRKPDGLAMVLSYTDRILMVNGFNWKKKFEASTIEHKDVALSIEIDKNEVRLANGKKKLKVKLNKKDKETCDILCSNAEKLKDSNWHVDSIDGSIILKNS